MKLYHNSLIDMINNPDIHAAALAGIPLTKAHEKKNILENHPSSEPMYYIIYKAGDIKEGLIALSKKNSQSETNELPNLIKEIIS